MKKFITPIIKLLKIMKFIIPMILINNSSEGIGRVPYFNPKKIVDNLKKNKGENLIKMNLWYKGFRGVIIEE